MGLITHTLAQINNTFRDRATFHWHYFRSVFLDLVNGFDSLASTDNGKGASQVGVEDAGSIYGGATNVEAALAKLLPTIQMQGTTSFGAEVVDLITSPDNLSTIPLPNGTWSLRGDIIGVDTTDHDRGAHFSLLTVLTVKAGVVTVHFGSGASLNWSDGGFTDVATVSSDPTGAKLTISADVGRAVTCLWSAQLALAGYRGVLPP